MAVNENFTFTVTVDPSSLSTRVSVGSPDQATVTIVDNDRKLSLYLYYSVTII